VERADGAMEQPRGADVKVEAGSTAKAAAAGVRRSGGVSAYEQWLKDYIDRRSIVVISPSVGMSFDSRAEAYEFYNLHSWELGFGMRCNMSQDIVCSCEVGRCSACVFVTLYNSVFQFQDMQCGLTVKIDRVF
jgi:hypothetical protein